METNMRGGVEANSTSLYSHSERLVRVLYRDHIIFWNSDPAFYESPNVREAVGWVEVETGDFLCITYDRSVKSLPHEKRECGLVLSKAVILEIREIRKPY
jgi:hypothetical protein